MAHYSSKERLFGVTTCTSVIWNNKNGHLIPKRLKSNRPKNATFSPPSPLYRLQSPSRRDDSSFPEDFTVKIHHLGNILSIWLTIEIRFCAKPIIVIFVKTKNPSLINTSFKSKTTFVRPWSKSRNNLPLEQYLPLSRTGSLDS